MERVAFHLNLRYWRQILVERTKVTKTMILLPRNLMLIKKRLQIPRMCGCQLDNLRSMILPNLMCWIAPKDDGKVSARCDQFLMATLTNHLLRKLVISRMPEFWTRIKFAKVQTYQCLQMIHIFKSLFWCNDPTSCSWVDEVGDNNDWEHLWSWYTEWSTFAWRYGIVLNIIFVQLWMVASSKTRKDVWLYFHHTFQWQYFWYVWTRRARQGCKDDWRDHGGRAVDKISW